MVGNADLPGAYWSANRTGSGSRPGTGTTIKGVRIKNSSATLKKRNALRKYWFDTIDRDSFPHAIDRLCADCGEFKSCKWMNSFTQTGKPEYRTKCTECQRKYQRDRVKATRPRRSTQALDRKYLRKKKCVEYLGGKCLACGYDRCVKAMTFHHRDATQKLFEISARLDYAWCDLKTELDKCDLLCFNCHMEEHCEEDQQARNDIGQPKTQGCEPHRTEKS